jgi:hypothetical protein
MRGIAAGVLVMVTWLLSAPASAGPIADGVDALTGFFGSRSYSYTGGGYSLTAEVDFAVYEPLAYPGSVPLSGADDYVYAYQIFNSAASTVGIGWFSVGLESGVTARNPGEDTSAGAPGQSGGQSPWMARVGSTSVSWLFDPEVPVGGRSTTLLFTSPYGPTWKSGALANGGLPTPGSGSLPSPMPEPASMALLGMGGLMMLVARVRRRMRA